LKDAALGLAGQRGIGQRAQHCRVLAQRVHEPGQVAVDLLHLAGVLRRQAARPRLRPADRAFLAALFIASLVPIIGFLIFQRSFLRGTGLGGAIKG